jgi:hypothetical protein
MGVPYYEISPGGPPWWGLGAVPAPPAHRCDQTGLPVRPQGKKKELLDRLKRHCRATGGRCASRERLRIMDLLFIFKPAIPRTSQTAGA